jgi:DNA polymerase II small subunit
MNQKIKLIEKLFEKGILANEDMLNNITEDDLDKINNEEDLLVLNSTNFKKQQTIDNWQEPRTEIIDSYQSNPYKYDINNFTKLFMNRFNYIEKILSSRQELNNIVSIDRIKNKSEREEVSIIGIITEINKTKNDNLILEVEDMTNNIKILISKNNKELHEEGKNLVVDEIIGINGTTSKDIIFANKIIFPDIPEGETKKGPVEEYAIFLSDIHYGSNLFLEKEFDKFIKWLNGEYGSEDQKEISKKVKYILIAGDLVDGIGIYLGQDDELTIKDIEKQYEGIAEKLAQIPKNKEIIICPGNHDSTHLAEPQPIFYKKYAQKLYDLENATIVSNPAMVNIGKKKNFSGFDVLMYHGYSFDYYVANVEDIRMNGGYKRSDLIMKFLLKRRHLAPSFTSTPYHPAYDDDPLLIKKIPDFFLTGHIHYSKVSNYKNVTLINGSCWQDKTSFQEKLGHTPEPGRVVAVNLKTREIKLIRFV